MSHLTTSTRVQTPGPKAGPGFLSAPFHIVVADTTVHLASRTIQREPLHQRTKVMLLHRTESRIPKKVHPTLDLHHHHPPKPRITGPVITIRAVHITAQVLHADAAVVAAVAPGVAEVAAHLSGPTHSATREASAR